MKPGAGGAIDQDHVALPGRIAGASLKRPCFIASSAMISPSPRQNRRGLIEAFTYGSHVPTMNALSPAESPGPH